MFTKLFSSITESSLWSEPKEVRLLFVTMLAKSDQNGFVEASVLGLARVANLTVDETEEGLKILSNPDPYSKNPDNEGRRITAVPGGFVLLNYEDYRGRRSSEDRREYMREYMKNYRKQNVNSVNPSKPLLDVVSHGKPKKKKIQRQIQTEETAGAVDLISIWNERVKEAEHPLLKSARKTPGRKKQLAIRMKDSDWTEAAIDAIAKLPIGGDGWQPDIGWLLRNSENAVELAEGKFDWRSENKQAEPATQTNGHLTPEQLAKIEAGAKKGMAEAKAFEERYGKQ